MLPVKDRTAVPGVLDQPHIPGLDGLRGLAILMVLAGHLLLNTRMALPALGSAGVDIFFVLSGFLITTLLLREKQKNGRVSLRRFYIRRALRIMPVAYLFLAVLLLCNFLFDLRLSAGSFAAAALYIGNIRFHYTANWFSGHFWTLSVEEQFYLIFPLVLVRDVRTYTWLVVAVILLVPALQYLTIRQGRGLSAHHLLFESAYFLRGLLENGTTSILAGSVLSILVLKGQLSAKLNRYASLPLLAAATALRLSGWIAGDTGYAMSLLSALLIAAAIYLVVSNPDDLLCKILNTKILTRLGVLSYSLYIWQQIFLYRQPWANTFKYSDSPWFNVPALFLTAFLSYYYFELRFLKLKAKFR